MDDYAIFEISGQNERLVGVINGYKMHLDSIFKHKKRIIYPIKQAGMSLCQLIGCGAIDLKKVEPCLQYPFCGEKKTIIVMTYHVWSLD